MQPLRSRGRLRRYFERNDGYMMDKWVHYFDVYERYLGRYRGTSPTLLEIGVSHGGSLQMWRDYFGKGSTIVGVDIEDRTSMFAGDDIEIRVGDQSDPEFLSALISEFGQFDAVIDDGSHRPAHQIASIEALWPGVAVGGAYIVEDLHTNYWPQYDSGPGASDSFMAWLSRRVDDMHAFHSRTPEFAPNTWTETIESIHVYDSVAVLLKANRERPMRRQTGRPAFDDLYGLPLHEILSEDHQRHLAEMNTTRARLVRAARDPRRVARRLRDRKR